MLLIKVVAFVDGKLTPSSLVDISPNIHWSKLVNTAPVMRTTSITHCSAHEDADRGCTCTKYRPALCCNRCRVQANFKCIRARSAGPSFFPVAFIMTEKSAHMGLVLSTLGFSATILRIALFHISLLSKSQGLPSVSCVVRSRLQLDRSPIRCATAVSLRWAENFGDVNSGFHVHHVGLVLLVGWLVTLVVVFPFIMTDTHFHVFGRRCRL